MHWVIAVGLLLYTVIPFISPILFETGHPRLGWYIQTMYSFFCHQRPERSIFLFGEQITYSMQDLLPYGYNGGLDGYTFVGNKNLGYKAAFCVRDTFLYGSMSIVGISILAMRKNIRIHWAWSIILCVPLILDGGLQFLSEFLYLSRDFLGIDLAKPFYLSNNVKRAVTGILFGTGVAVFLFNELTIALRKDAGVNDT